ncbi:MAG: energy transducer TonB [Kangiellaceae bacterium]|jgi:protein TonB|nr:energy transducer TonB [Kangiellaceae bacterium]
MNLIRISLFAAAALSVVVGLMVLMSKLVEADDIDKRKVRELTDYGDFNVDLKTIEKTRDKPPKPAKVKKPEKVEPVAKPQQPTKPVKPALSILPSSASQGITLPSIGDIDGIGDIVGQSSQDGDLMPKVMVEPVYPTEARYKNLDGEVTVEFDVNQQGRVENAKVISAKPKHTFNKAALRAVRKWTFTPKKVDGRALASSGQRVTLTFAMEQ